MSVAVQLPYPEELPETAPAAWSDVCALEDIPVNCGVAALLGGRQVALVRVQPEDECGPELYALSNFDPFSEAFVMARGIVGDRGGCPKIASPMYKHSFDLRTGICFEDPSVALATFRVRVREGRVEVAMPGQNGGDGGDACHTDDAGPVGAKDDIALATGLNATRRR